MNQPFPPAKPGEAPAQLGPTLAQNLLRALSDLRNTQDNFMSVWLNYEAARINLAFQLGILEVGPDGIINITPLKQARANTTPIETLDEKDIPVEAYLRQLDNVMAHGGDAEKAMQQHPDDKLVKQVETTTGEVITPADVDQPAGEKPSDANLVEEPDQPRLETWRERMARVMKLSGKEVPVSITKLDFPRTVREFKNLKDKGLSDEAISEKTGWDQAAIKALAEVLETSQRPVVQNIPLQPPAQEASPPAENVKLARHQESTNSPPQAAEQTSWEEVETLPEPESPPANGPVLPLPKGEHPTS